MDLNIPSPEESDRIVDHEIVHFSSWKLRNKECLRIKLEDQNVEGSYSYLRLAPRLPELTSKLERLNCSNCSGSTPSTGKKIRATF